MICDVYNQAMEYYGVSHITLRRWIKKGRLASITTPGGQCRYFIGTIMSDTRKDIIYARVSTVKQAQDLQRQIKYLQLKYPNAVLISDLGSSLKHNRKGYLRMLNMVTNNEVNKIYCTEKDRISRFSMDLVMWICSQHNTTVVVDSEDSQKTITEELWDDVSAVMQSFSGKFYGRRANKRKADTDSTGGTKPNV